MYQQILVITGIIINAISSLAYVIDTIKGKIQPNRVTYFLWSFAPLVAYAAQIAQDVGVQSLMTLSVGIFPLIIFLSSFLNKKAYWKLTLFDLSCGLLSFIGLFLWYITRIGNIAIVFSITADLLATLPTIVKGYRYPETEIGWPWLLTSIGGLLTLVSIQHWNFANYGFPLYYTITMFFLFLTIHFKLGKKIK